jgi:hypothetical protein
MLREFLSGIALADLPVAAMLLFLLLFAGALCRVLWRGAAAYRQMAALPLDETTAPRTQP